MDSETIDALRNVLLYLKQDEERHWEESGRPSGHIYEDILLVEHWLDT